MSDVASLFFGLAAVITALFTGITGLVAVLRAPRKVAEHAARLAIDRALGQDDEEPEPEGDRDEARDELLKRLLERRQDDGDQP